jgi:putative ABC transport system ATP-binding protein
MTVTQPESRSLYELHDVSKTYTQGDNEIRAVREIDLVVEQGEFLVVAGPSGSGKTTLLQLLGALDRPSAGEILFEGRDLSGLRDVELSDLRLRTFGFIFQQFNLIPTLTAAQNVEVALAPRGIKSAPRRKAAHGLLESVGLAARAAHLPSQLSGGEQQRVAIARALANEPRVLLADEPTGNLDSATGDEIVDLLTSLSAERRQTIVLITHNSRIADRAPRVVHMRDGGLRSAEEPAAPNDLGRGDESVHGATEVNQRLAPKREPGWSHPI